MEYSFLQIAFFASVFVGISLWDVIMHQRYNVEFPQYPYAQAFALFSMLQWVLIGIGMISIFGALVGMLFLAFCIIVLRYICRFSIGRLWIAAAKNNYLLPTALFSTNVLILLILVILVIFN